MALIYFFATFSVHKCSENTNTFAPGIPTSWLLNEKCNHTVAALQKNLQWKTKRHNISKCFRNLRERGVMEEAVYGAIRFNLIFFYASKNRVLFHRKFPYLRFIMGTAVAVVMESFFTKLNNLFRWVSWVNIIKSRYPKLNYPHNTHTNKKIIKKNDNFRVLGSWYFLPRLCCCLCLTRLLAAPRCMRCLSLQLLLHVRIYSKRSLLHVGTIPISA